MKQSLPSKQPGERRMTVRHSDGSTLTVRSWHGKSHVYIELQGAGVPFPIPRVVIKREKVDGGSWVVKVESTPCSISSATTVLLPDDFHDLQQTVKKGKHDQ